MDGVVVQDEVIIAAGTLVPPGKVLESGYLYKGNPARKARPLSDKERSFFNYTSKRYVDLARKYIDEQA
jgi:carbonic anhydrase/acetyltransferase-like protein (isoleucine patch superfamily)